MIVHRMLIVELIIKLCQRSIYAGSIGQRCRINQVIVGTLHRQVVALEPFQIHKADALRVIIAYLINGETVTLMGQKSRFPFLLVVMAFHDFLMEHRAFLPFLTGNGK